ncbi:hypothetical protein [Thiohalomonas denitrificans]|uniref:hypothetical protein n=1 Tax=Thiohalomonas denitrificans TaxID=415747 RepID=UPI0026EF71E3|nr:hypothetical protein [Thiohalomonas denitrificans]
MSETIEYGNVYFLYRPRIDTEQVESLEDVQRVYLVLSPHGKKRYRLLVMGRKRLPEIHDGGERYWGFVGGVEDSAVKLRKEFEAETYETKTRGTRQVPPARPAGEGVYALVEHGGHTHLAYALELPKEPDEVQKELNIAPEASFIVSVKNPDKPSPPSAGLGRRQQARFPKHLMEKFRDRRFIEIEPPDYLDYEGAELMMIGAREDAERELEIDLDPQDEDVNSAEMFSDLRIRKSRHPIEPLFEGRWE